MAISETGNFTRAAERCGVSQPSLSQQIINLERELGQKLLHRLGRKAVPTEAGKIFMERARSILLEVESASRELKDSPTLERRIKVGTVPTLAPYLLPPVLKRCRENHPNLLINTHEDFRHDLLKGVVDGDLDLAIVPLPINDRRVVMEQLFHEDLMLVVDRNHPLATKPDITARDLASESFVLLGHSSTLAMEIERFCGDHDFTPRLGHRCSQISTVKALVGLGTGISILPRLAILPQDAATLVYRDLSGRVPTRELVVVRHLQRYQTKGSVQFLKELRATVAALVAAGKINREGMVPTTLASGAAPAALKP